MDKLPEIVEYIDFLDGEGGQAMSGWRMADRHQEGLRRSAHARRVAQLISERDKWRSVAEELAEDGDEVLAALALLHSSIGDERQMRLRYAAGLSKWRHTLASYEAATEDAKP